MHESSNSGGNMPYMEEPPSYISLYPEFANAGYSRPNLQVNTVATQAAAQPVLGTVQSAVQLAVKSVVAKNGKS